MEIDIRNDMENEAIGTIRVSDDIILTDSPTSRGLYIEDTADGNCVYISFEHDKENLIKALQKACELWD